ncbi:hypothetical protein F0562_014967 [Nyssa sinensis]|uniref:Exportin-2 central domain-containing protein n=1 Tax=Nyssa sinensis TaxID=561372 RepID=A0A5J4ZUF8_9ASTE|nr:hypothetical protein F0562_014967 [Nyssa sinensis]
MTEFQKYLTLKYPVLKVGGGDVLMLVDGVRAAVSFSNRDQLTVTAIKFLTTVSLSIHHILFARDDVLQICQNIVIPNVMLRDEDEEFFEMNYVEFIRRDMEGSDLDLSRRIAYWADFCSQQSPQVTG